LRLIEVLAGLTLVDSSIQEDTQALENNSEQRGLASLALEGDLAPMNSWGGLDYWASFGASAL
jgi:hypothetical protein